MPASGTVDTNDILQQVQRQVSNVHMQETHTLVLVE